MQEYEETIYFPPDTTAGIFLLKNWAGYMNEPIAMKYRKKELELKEKQVDAQIWQRVTMYLFYTLRYGSELTQEVHK